MALITTRFRDLAQNEAGEREALSGKSRQYAAIAKRRSSLTPQEQDDETRIKEILEVIADTANSRVPEVAHPVFVGTRALFAEGDCLLGEELLTHDKDGVLVFDDPGTDQNVTRSTLVLGILLVDKIPAPPVEVLTKSAASKAAAASKGGNPSVLTRPKKGIYPITTDPNWKRLTQSFYEAIGEARGLEDLALLVLPILAREGDPDQSGGPINPSVNVTEFAQVMRLLEKRGVTAREPQLSRRVNEALDKIQYVGENGPVEDMGINLPDLDEVTDYNIVRENVRLMGPMIVSAMFDELKAFQVVDKIVEQYQRGTLPIGEGPAGKMLYQYWREAPNRMSEMERRTFYSTTMGIPGGEGSDFVNREFNDLWLRFVSSVSEFVRQAEVDSLLRTKIPSAVSHQQVRKAARDLASNLSLHGYGMAHYAARELQGQIRFVIDLLGTPEIQSAYGSRDMWQVIDQVATLELGGARTSSRYRTLATCGTIITAWLSGKVKEIMAASGPFLEIDEIRHPKPKLSGQRATTHPNDYDLVNACELWLADTGTSDSRVEELSQPQEAPVQTSRPIQVPAVVQDMLDGIGGLGVGLSKGR